MADSLTHFITADRFLKRGNFSKDFERGMRFGVQGPDIFFFGGGKESFIFGDKLHDSAPKAFFELEADKIDSRPDLYRGYYFGVLLHYFEDRIMHQYVGYLCRKYPSPVTHGTVEREFDIVLYKREYGKPIRTFPVKKYYEVTDDITDVIFDFWHKRTDDPILTRDFCDHALRQTFKLTALLLKANPLIVAVMKQKERKSGEEGVYTCHFKTGYNEGNMNLEKAIWDSPIASYDLSVPEIVQKGVDDFEKEFALIEAKCKSGEPYTFVHTEAFSCGK